MELNLAIFVSGGGLAFRALVEAQRVGILSLKELILICDRQSEALAFAQRHHHPAYLVPFERFVVRDDFDTNINDILRKHEINLAILNFNRLLSASTLEALNHSCINLHLSLLPLFPGFGAVNKALKSGMKLSGVTFHWVDDTIDAGKIISQQSAPIFPDDTPATLTRRLYRRAVPVQLQLVRSLSQHIHIPAQGCLSLYAVDEDIEQFSQRYLDAIFIDP